MSSFKEAVKETVEIEAAGIPYLLLCFFTACSLFLLGQIVIAPVVFRGC